jgi:protoporphyrinogen oxidase
MDNKTIILGAGPAGLFCANELSLFNRKALLIESQQYAGGLCRTLNHGKFRFDFGPHIFFSDDAYIKNIIKSLLKDDLLEKEWKVMQLIGKKRFAYPNNAFEVLFNVGPIRFMSFFFSYLRYKTIKPKNNFDSYICSKVGKNLAEFNILNYTEKMWGIPSQKLSSSWIKDRLHRLSFLTAVRQSILPEKKFFFYPRYGTGQLYELISKKQEIMFKSRPTKIVHDSNRMKYIVVKNRKIAANNLVSSIPIADFVKLLEPLPPKEVLAAAFRLRYRSQIFLLLTLKKEHLMPYTWIYFPDKNIPFARIYEPNNFSDKMSPKCESSLVVEYFCFTDDNLWRKKESELYKMSVKHLVDNKIISQELILGYKVIKVKNTYPIFDLEHEKNLRIVDDYLKRFNNLHMIGRHGIFTHDNQDQAARSGIIAARKIASVGESPKETGKRFIDF